MDKTQRRWLVRVFVFFAAVMCIIMIIHRLKWTGSFGYLKQAGPLLILLLSLVALRPIAEFLDQLPAPHLTVLAAFLALVMMGQYVHHARRTFPFVPWNMYSQSRLSNHVDNIFYVGYDSRGNEVILSLKKLFPPAKRSLGIGIGQKIDPFLRGIEKKPAVAAQPQGADTPSSSARLFLKNIASRVRALLPDIPVYSTEELKGQFVDVMRAVVKRYNQLHPDRPIVKLAVLKESFDFTENGIGPRQRNIVWWVPLKKEERYGITP